MDGQTQAFNVATLPPGVDLCQIMRDEAARRPDAAPCWFVHGDDQFPLLTVGLRGDGNTGALTWEEPTSAGPLAVYVPVGGTNLDEVDYFAGNRDHGTMPPECEVSAELALAAVAEYTRTGQRPTCVEWRQTHD